MQNRKTKQDNLIKCFLSIATFLIPFYFFRFDIFNIPTNVFEIAVLISLIVFAFNSSLIIHKSKFVFGPVWLYCLLAFAVVGVLMSSDKTSALGILKGWFVVPAVYYFLIINTFNKDNIKQLSVPLLVSVVVISVWAIMQKLGLISTLFYQTTDSSFDQYLGENFRVFGPFESPNYLAMFLAPATFLSIPVFNFLRLGYQKLLIAFLFILPIVALAFSGSLGGVVAAFLALIVAICIIARKKSLSTGILIYFLSFVLIAVIILAVKVIGFDFSVDAIRIQIYQYSREIIRENWLFGIGLGEFQNFVLNLCSDVEGFKTHALPYAIHPHNLYYAFAIYLGVGGFLSFIIASIWLFVKAWSARAHSYILAGAAAAYVTILVHGFVDTTYYKNDLSAIFWLIFAVVTIISTKDAKK